MLGELPSIPAFTFPIRLFVEAKFEARRSASQRFAPQWGRRRPESELLADLSGVTARHPTSRVSLCVVFLVGLHRGRGWHQISLIDLRAPGFHDLGVPNGPFLLLLRANNPAAFLTFARANPSHDVHITWDLEVENGQEWSIYPVAEPEAYHLRLRCLSALLSGSSSGLNRQPHRLPRKASLPLANQRPSA